MLTKLGKYLSKHSASNVIVPATRYNYSESSYRCARNRPLNVIFSTNATKKTSLEKVKRSHFPDLITGSIFLTYSRTDKDKHIISNDLRSVFFHY